MSSKLITSYFNAEELEQEELLKLVTKQNNIRRRAVEYTVIIAEHEHYLNELQKSCIHPGIVDGKCSDCLAKLEK